MRNAWAASLLAAALLPVLAVASASTADDPRVLQARGIQRVDRYVAHYRQTGDDKSLLSDLQTGVSELKASYDGFVAGRDFAGAALSALTLGDVARYQKQWDAALQFYARAGEWAERANHPGYQARALIGLARAQKDGRGNPGAAMDLVTQAIPLATRAEIKDYLFNALDLAASLELLEGNLNAAGDYMDRALTLKDSLHDRALLIFGYMDRGAIYYDRGGKCDYDRNFDLCDRAFELCHNDYEQALGIARDLGFPFIAAQLQTMVQNADARRSVMQSQKKYAGNVALATSVLLHPKKASDVLVTEKFTAGPDPLLQAQLQRFLPQFNPADPRSLYIQALSEQMKGNNDGAIAAYRQAIELLEQDRRKLRDDQSRGTFLEDKIDFYYSPSLLLLDLRRLPEAFDLMERSRARAMADLLASRPLALRTAREGELFSETVKLKAQIGLEQQKLFGMTADRARHGSEIAGLEGQISQLEGQLREVQARIAAEAPKLEELTVSQPATLASAQLSAKRDSYDLVYYLVVEHAVIVWVINGEGVIVRNVFLPRAEVTAKVAALRKSLVDRETIREAQFDVQTSRELFLFLIQPVLNSIRTGHLIIVPHEDLNNLPFQVLQNPADGTYLGERFQVSYAPSASVLASLRRKQNLADSRLLAAAYPITGDETAEVEAIGRLYPGRSKVVTGAPVRKEDLKAWVGQYDVVHLSVHGFFDMRDALLSYLELKPTAQDDGHLTAAEMFGLPLAKESLVVVSACETGRVTATHGNEVLGMVRGLLYAGANNLVLTSWKVDPQATAYWMETFYRQAKAKAPSEAARLALLAVKANPKYRDPYFWGAFLLTGK